MNMSRFATVLLLLGIGTSALVAQSNNFQLAFITGDTLSDAALVSLRDDTLSVLHEGMSRLIRVGSLNEVRLVKESAVWEHAKQYGLVGGIAGGLVSGMAIAVSAHGGSFYSLKVSNTTAKILGALLGAVVYGAVCAVLGGIAGTVAGLIQGTDKVYDLSQMPLKGKIVTLQEILSHQ